MANELANLESLGDLPIQKYTDQDFDLVASGGFLARLQLMTSASDDCKSGKFPINHYALVQNKCNVDLGAEVDVLPLYWRPKALEMGEQVIAVYEPSNAEFKRIVAQSEVPNSRCMYGPEFLVWVPSVHQFATFFMGSKSARRESGNLKGRMNPRQMTTLGSHEIKTTKFTWYAPTVQACSADPSSLPDAEQLNKVATAFNNPPTSEIETVEETGAPKRER